MKIIVYLGFNNPYVYKRGVENVIYFQHLNGVFFKSLYVFFDEKDAVFRWDDILCISIKNDLLKYFKLNILFFNLRRRYKSIFIHSHNILMSILLFYKTNLLTIHDAIYYQRRSNKDRKAFIFSIVEFLSLFKCKSFHFISKYTLSKSLIRNLITRKFIIYNTCTFEGLIGQMNERRNVDEFKIFAVRGIQKRTRVDLLIDFAQYVHDKKIDGKDIHLYIVGKGPLLEQYKRRIENLNLHNVSLLGYLSDSCVTGYYKSCDYVIMPCEYAEGFGLPIIEGYYYNKPVIASNKCAVPEIIIDKSYLFENNVESIWETLNRTLHLKFDFRSYYNEKFSHEVILNEYDQLYQLLS